MKLFLTLSLLFWSTLLHANYIEIHFTGVIDTVNAGGKTTGQTISGMLRYEPDADRSYPSTSMSYPFQTNFTAFPSPIFIEGSELTYPSKTYAHAVDWSNDNREDLTFSSSGYLKDGLTDIRIECKFTGEDIFDSIYSLPQSMDLNGMDEARFSYIKTLPSELNLYAESYSGTITSINFVVKPVQPEILMLLDDQSNMVFQYYGNLKFSTDLTTWQDFSLPAIGYPVIVPFPSNTISIDKSYNKQLFFKAVE